LVSSSTRKQKSNDAKSSTPEITKTKSKSSASEVTRTKADASPSEITKTKSKSSASEVTRTKADASPSEITKIKTEPSTSEVTKTKNNSDPRPEKRLVDFGLKLVILDKTLSGVGMLAFIWATVVLLGGFASTLKTIDFWFVATITFINGTGMFSRSHQLDSRFFFQAVKAISSKLGRMFTFFQLSTAGIPIAFSMMRLVEQNYSEDKGQTNMKAALNIFYAATLSSALIFLIEKAYWYWTVTHLKIMEDVSGKCGFEEISGVVSVRRFFYETYWKLSKGNVFRALELDLTTFAQYLLISNVSGDQLISVRILNGLISHKKLSDETLCRIRSSPETTSRLVQMLSWHDQREQNIRILAAKVVVSLANELQLEGIPEATDCICSLLEQEDGLNGRNIKNNLVGLKILRNLASNPMNCLKITEKTNCISKIVDLTKVSANTFDNKENDEFRMVISSLKLLKNIVSTEGEEGKIIRRDILKISTIISNLRNILIYAEFEFKLFKIVVQILAALSMEEGARKKIGSTDGIIGPLMSKFLNPSRGRSNRKLMSIAGDALAALTLESKKICCKILKENAVVVQDLSATFNKPNNVYQSTTAMKILRNMCAYAGTKWENDLRELITELPLVSS
jgi:hypothetical protein